jgi:predicted small secreted protein
VGADAAPRKDSTMSGSRLVRLAVFLVLGLAAVTLSGCNTMEGIGEDISAAGQGMADLSAKANPDNK